MNWNVDASQPLADRPAFLTDDAIKLVWKAATTRAANVITQRQNRLNDEDGPDPVLNEQTACREAIKASLELDAHDLHEVKTMLREQTKPPSPEADMPVDPDPMSEADLESLEATMGLYR